MQKKKKKKKGKNFELLLVLSVSFPLRQVYFDRFSSFVFFLMNMMKWLEDLKI